VIGMRRRKQNRKHTNDRNFTREMAKTKNREIFCCQSGTNDAPIGTDRSCGSTMACTTMRLVQVPGNSTFCIFKDPNAFI